MSTVAAEVGLTATGLPPQGRLAAAWGTAEQQARVFGALRASLADEMLPPLRAEVQELLPHFSWFLVAETMRIADSPQWRDGLLPSKSAMGHQMLWLMRGGDSPSPRLLQGGHHATLRVALTRVISEGFEDAWVAEEKKRVKKEGGVWQTQLPGCAF